MSNQQEKLSQIVPSLIIVAMLVLFLTLTGCSTHQSTMELEQEAKACMVVTPDKEVCYKKVWARDELNKRKESDGCCVRNGRVINSCRCASPRDLDELRKIFNY